MTVRRPQVAGLAMLLLASQAVAATPGGEFPPGSGRPKVQVACGPCHAITIVTSARKSEAEWERTMNAMITRGARVPDEDYDIILDYLVRNFSAQLPDVAAAPARH